MVESTTYTQSYDFYTLNSEGQREILDSYFITFHLELELLDTSQSQIDEEYNQQINYD